MVLPFADFRTAELVRIYTSAARQISAELESMVFALDSSRYQRYQQILRLLQELRGRTRGWTNKYLEDFFQQEQSKAIYLLAKHSVFQIDRLKDRLATKSVAALADSLITATDKAVDSVKSLATKVVQRRASIEKKLGEDVVREIAEQLVQGKSFKAATAKVRSVLQREFTDGIVSVTGRGGGTYRYSLDYYAAMVTNQTLKQASSAAVISAAMEADHDLVRVSPQPSIVPKGCICDMYAGKVLSISGESDKFPALGDTPNGGPPFHPWCRHTLEPFISGLHSDEELDEFANVPEEFLMTGENTFSQLLASARMKMAVR